MKKRWYVLSIGLTVLVTGCGKSETALQPSAASPVSQTAPVKAALPAVDTESAAVVEQLSFCSGSALAQSIWARENGQTENADTLERATDAYAKTAFDYGPAKGYSEADILALIEKGNRKVRDELRAEDVSSQTINNQNCRDLLKHHPGLHDIFYQYFKKS